MKLSDYVFKFYKENNVRNVFMLSGGGIMHLVDSLGHSGISYTCCHHEQAASIAAQAATMYDETPAICLSTTGPGGTNALTGCAAAYVDSTPVVFLSGQVKRSDFAALRNVRQFGAQENDIISMAKPVTKYAKLIENPEDIRYELEKSFYIATHGRKGPVWLDIPLDIQSAEIDEDSLRGFDNYELSENNAPKAVDKAQLEEIYGIISSAQRPLLLIGQGAVSSGAYDSIRELISLSGIPVMSTWRALDFMDTEEEGFYGSPGLQAPRYSNLIIQNADVLLVLGSRLDNMITAFNEEHFAYKAKRIIVDIDENEIDKLNMPGKIKVVCDVKSFTDQLVSLYKEKGTVTTYDSWIQACNTVKDSYPILAEKQDKEEYVNLYKITDTVSKYSKSDDVIVISSTSRCNTAGHIAFRHKKGQKTISSMGMGSMGFAIPSAVGAYEASKKRVIVFEGDGSLQLNIQELQTIVSYNVDAKMFIFDNRGYAAITTMQDRNFDSFYVGSNEKSGVVMPDTVKVAEAYGIKCFEIDADSDIEKVVSEAMDYEGPVIVSVRGSLYFDEIPKCISWVNPETGLRQSAALENPYPFMTPEKLDEVITILNN
ncbi:MAG: thiamine pyrophosphate-binding protein [Eubacterium sp.]|nr:thiamine pyrophosphate-binding protein [Eubacterium sp.]